MSILKKRYNESIKNYIASLSTIFENKILRKKTFLAIKRAI